MLSEAETDAPNGPHPARALVLTESAAVFVFEELCCVPVLIVKLTALASWGARLWESGRRCQNCSRVTMFLFGSTPAPTRIPGPSGGMITRLFGSGTLPMLFGSSRCRPEMTATVGPSQVSMTDTKDPEYVTLAIQ
ncbi:hypothetical protein [Kitasatospora sp. NPDC058218]|uniref:hypothetical protein n=1 Tax=Kitasatospora sp. NPDC058218 TaxID=3346385 RepID=UPI0036DDE586